MCQLSHEFPLHLIYFFISLFWDLLEDVKAVLCLYECVTFLHSKDF